MSFTLKQRFARLNMSKLPKSYTDEFDIMEKETAGFSDDDLNAVFEENFNDLYALVEKKYPDAIKAGGTVKKEKPAKVKVVKKKEKPAGMGTIDDKFKEVDLTEFKKDHPEKFKGPKALPKVTYNGVTMFVDFRLGEVRDVKAPHNITPFGRLDNELKAKIRGIRAEYSPNVYMEGLDDLSTPSLKGKLSKKDIFDIEAAIWEANWGNKLHKETDANLTESLMKDFGLTKSQAENWTKQRDKYKEDMVYGEYEARTEKKKSERRSKDEVKTRDGFIFNRKDTKNVGEKFFDENGKEWKCKGYNAKLDECILEDKDGKEISACLKDMYVSNPVVKREKGNMIDDCKDELKKAGYSVKEHKAGGKKIKRSAPRPEKAIIKERVKETFTPIMKDLKGSEDKEKENKEIITALENIQGLFTKFMNRISNLADDGKLEAIKKIEKLLKEIVD